MRVLQNRTTVKRESDLLITTMFTDRIGRHEVLLQISHNHYNFRQKIHLENKSPVKTMYKVKIPPIWKFPSFS